jgi:hypothetical protein
MKPTLKSAILCSVTFGGVLQGAHKLPYQPKPQFNKVSIGSDQEEADPSYLKNSQLVYGWIWEVYSIGDNSKQKDREKKVQEFRKILAAKDLSRLKTSEKENIIQSAQKLLAIPENIAKAILEIALYEKENEGKDVGGYCGYTCGVTA